MKLKHEALKKIVMQTFVCVCMFFFGGGRSIVSNTISRLTRSHQTFDGSNLWQRKFKADHLSLQPQLRSHPKKSIKHFQTKGVSEIYEKVYEVEGKMK